MDKVCVVVPVYRSELTEYEEISLRQNAEVLRSRDVVFVTPTGLDVSRHLAICPHASVETFDPEFFRGIAGYNRFMMSPELYRRFADYEYMLVCQLDAYLFRDELDDWCARGYDYVGAPWVVRRRYSRFPFKQTSALKHWYRSLLGKPDKRRTRWQVGNGGLSLRRISSHLKATEELGDVVAEYLSHTGNHLYYEDVFFSTEVNRHGERFRYPDWREALGFSFDIKPELCYKLNGGRLPMGCHSWFGRKMRRFWFPLILPSPHR